MGNPAIRPQPNGDVDIAVPDSDNRSETSLDETSDREQGPGPEPSVHPENLDHPEELMGE
jgi:hypothetical protein